MFEFDVNTNIGNKVGLTIMFEVYVESIMKDSEILAEQELRLLTIFHKYHHLRTSPKTCAPFHLHLHCLKSANVLLLIGYLSI